ncbi:MAG: hypothetical protein EA396_03815 [Anaerolineaceae bacterium]|nr:MAG: hypothetical protein EA396_03815 [Anaerolineaceae bacterium]
MPKLRPTPELLRAIIERVPEGFLHQAQLTPHIEKSRRKNAPAFRRAIALGYVGWLDPFYYDPERCTPEQVKAMGDWCNPGFPAITDGGILRDRPIDIQRRERQNQLAESTATDYVQIVRQVEQSEQGYLTESALIHSTDDQRIVDDLIGVGVLGRIDGLIYDPLRLSAQTVEHVLTQRYYQTQVERLCEVLQAETGHTAPQEAISKAFDDAIIQHALDDKAIASFSVRMKKPPYKSTWLILKGADSKKARSIAQQAVRIPDAEWEPMLVLCGDVTRPGAKDASTLRSQVVARSYNVKRAATRLAVSVRALNSALDDDLLMTFTDPEGRLRIPAYQIEAAIEDREQHEAITAYEILRPRDLAIVESVSYSTIRRRLRRMGIKHAKPTWRKLRGQWNLPSYYVDYVEKLDGLLAEQQRQRDAEREQMRQLAEAQREAERREREALRQRLLESFPSWRHDGRADQHVSLHIGPPNSGKTHQSLEALIAAGAGWYLAPLRLLAFEIFDRLNQRGVPCNLLTGEEYIPVPGAQITAATIEMFNPENSGDCIIIDEAQMLADTDRGWAWTRALMEARTPEIHVIAPDTTHDLIRKLVTGAEIPHTVVHHQRLAPIKVADQAWPLEMLKPRTILVAFSRRMVLHLKSELEALKRSVSVVYGALPPEVRRKQADRFADGETEICVATDAVGMGLNLPADYVCFYEVEKYDGEQVRPLKPSELQQIGGRAGRYGYSKAGEVGAVYPADLQLVRKSFYADPGVLTHAHVAPTVADLELIPGHLAERLEQWRALDSIPEALRDSIKTTDLDERIELARMLTDDDVAALGLDAALRLVNAPTRQSSRAYWLSCARAIINRRQMPLPPAAPRTIKNSRDLETTESAISCADIYMWLSRRREFTQYGAEDIEVRAARGYWSTQIDEALLRKIDTARRCSQCGRRLPNTHRHGVCDRCFRR